MPRAKHVLIATMLLITSARAQDSIAPKPAQDSVAPKPTPDEDDIVVRPGADVSKLRGKARTAVIAFLREDYVLAEKLFKELAVTEKQNAFFDFASAAGIGIDLDRNPFRPPPEAAVLEYLSGLSAARQGKLQPAKEAFLRALVIDPKYSKARADLTLAYVLSGDLEKAQIQLTRLRNFLRRCTRGCDALKARIATLEATYQKTAAQP